MKLVILLILNAMVSQVWTGKAMNPKLSCYDRQDRLIFETTKNLRQTSSFKSDKCCTSGGAWLIYSNFNFNGKVTIIRGKRPIKGQMGKSCELLQKNMNHFVKSVRFTGVPGNIIGPSITFFENEFFQGNMQVFQNWAEGVNPKSMVINGCKDWSLYGQPNFKGSCSCLYKNNDCVSKYVPTMRMLGQVVRSAKMNCMCESIPPTPPTPITTTTTTTMDISTSTSTTLEPTTSDARQENTTSNFETNSTTTECEDFTSTLEPEVTSIQENITSTYYSEVTSTNEPGIVIPPVYDKIFD